MLSKNYSAKPLNLEDVIITNVENISEKVNIYLRLPSTKHRCPACGNLTDRVHDYRVQTIKNVPLDRKRCCICANGVTVVAAANVF